MRTRSGFTLVELLLALAILGVLLGAALGLLQSSAQVERGERALSSLAQEVGLAATALAREAYLAGYGLGAGTPLALGGALTLRFLCDSGMEPYCSQDTMGRTRAVAYELRGETLYYGACADPCTPSITNPVLDGVERFRVAYRSGGAWSAAPLTVTLSSSGASPKVEMLALYLAARSPLAARAGSFTPGRGVDWSAAPDGEALKSLLLSGYAPPGDGRPRAERLVVVGTPNLNR
jgi:prepilin-type N-terminal cleavage/methylation domain-containing protein